ncbi:protein ZNRD2 [Phalacrocorax carbo]|uniref:protein ZNRD2 n=1 Tax=Phalacrocorax carbo TaxID=9209 RepID=UPI0031191FD4
MALNAGAEPFPGAAAELEARRERQERTILLQDKQQQLYCVACQELDCDGAGGGPAPEPSSSSPPPPRQPAAPRPEHCEGAATGLRGAPPGPPGPPGEAAVGAARAAVLEKLACGRRGSCPARPRPRAAPSSAPWCGPAPRPWGGCRPSPPPAAPHKRSVNAEPTRGLLLLIGGLLPPSLGLGGGRYGASVG